MQKMTRRPPRRALAIVLLAPLVAVAAHAACVPQTDDSGCFTTDPTHSLCEQRASHNAAVMGQAMLTCHRKMARSALAGQPLDEEACEAAAVQKFLAKTDVTNCPCIATSSVTTTWETQLDALNGYVYCDAAGTAFGGDDGGRAPVTRAESRCEDNLAKCVAKLVKDSETCHRSAAKAAVKGTAFDEEACEEGPIPGKPGKAATERYDACVARVLAQRGCTGCESPAAAAAFVDNIIDDRNDLIYCMDQPNACPSTYELTAIGNAVDQDFGWEGFAHDEPLTSNVRLTLAVGGCANAAPPCGECTLSGPIPNDGPVFANRRCRGASDGSSGMWMQCASDADCPGAGNGCVFFLGPPQPLAYGGLASCFTYEIASPITGTLDVDSGAAVLPLTLAWTPYGLVNPAYARPCPRCVAGTCDGGDRLGAPCVVTGTSSLFGDDLSFDCPPVHSMLIARSTLAMHLTTGAQTATISSASPTCTAGPYSAFQCLCDTCDNAAATPCFNDADCVAAGATHCGGKRCRGGANNGTPCASPSECPGGACGRVGVPTQPNPCDDAVCTPNTPPDGGSVDEGVCLAGPFELFCAAEPFRGCLSDADCRPGDTCTLGKLRECFPDNGTVGGSVSVSGVASTTTPTFGALFCAPPNGNSFFDVRGLPGLARLTIPGIAVIH